MSYSVTAMTSGGPINVHSSSVGTIRLALSDARSESATNISLTQDGKVIDESQLGKVTAALIAGTTTTTTA